MVRAILSAVVGYILMVAISIAGVAATWFGLGPRFAFVGETNQASLGWSLLQLGCGCIAAIAAGALTTKLAGKEHAKGLQIFVAMLVFLGLLSLITTTYSNPTELPPGKTIDTLSFSEAGQYARSPLWYLIAIIFVVCAGAKIGSLVSVSREPKAA
ncbi:MAG: hypothetical protein ACK5PZ_19440 [Pirellula sp.]|jgi:hypothetical protein